jgi:hypothetical protein
VDINRFHRFIAKEVVMNAGKLECGADLKPTYKDNVDGHALR